MKLIKCQNCGAERIGPKTDKWPDGAPVIWGYFSGGGNWVAVKCMRCTGSFKMTAADYHGLPALSEAQKKELLASKPHHAVD